MSKRMTAGVATFVVLISGILSWVFTAPYLGNQGLSRYTRHNHRRDGYPGSE